MLQKIIDLPNLISEYLTLDITTAETKEHNKGNIRIIAYSLNKKIIFNKLRNIHKTYVEDHKNGKIYIYLDTSDDNIKNLINKNMRSDTYFTANSINWLYVQIGLIILNTTLIYNKNSTVFRSYPFIEDIDIQKILEYKTTNNYLKNVISHYPSKEFLNCLNKLIDDCSCKNNSTNDNSDKMFKKKEFCVIVTLKIIYYLKTHQSKGLEIEELIDNDLIKNIFENFGTSDILKQFPLDKLCSIDHISEETIINLFDRIIDKLTSPKQITQNSNINIFPTPNLNPENYTFQSAMRQKMDQQIQS